MKKFKVAVIGCGAIAPCHLEALKALDNVELVAVCDIRKELAVETARSYGVKAYTDYMELFVKEQLHAVHICLPHYLHTVVAREAFSSGINVLSEKPMGILYEDAVQTADLADNCGLQYGVIFQNRYNRTVQLVKQRILDGRLGKVLGARTVLMWCKPDRYYTRSDWKGTWEKEGGGVMINQSIHILDQANWFIESTPISVRSQLTNWGHPTIEVEDTAQGVIDYENGARLVFYATNNYVVNDPVEICLQCENGSAVISGDQVTITYSDGTMEKEENCTDPATGKDYWGNMHAVQIYHFYEALAGREVLELSAREALKIQKIICEIYREPHSKLKG